MTSLGLFYDSLALAALLCELSGISMNSALAHLEVQPLIQHIMTLIVTSERTREFKDVVLSLLRVDQPQE